MGLVKPVSGARFSWWNQQDEGRGLHGTAVEKRLLSRIPALNSNSTAGKEFLARTYGIPEATIAVYNNGTPLPGRAVPSIAWRERLGLGERKIVTMIANLTRFKDHATLIDAWALVRKHRMDSPPALLFAGYLNDAETVSRLKLQAFDLGMSTSDVYLLGPVDDVVGLIGASDLVVHSSLTEGCPNAVCEAMAAGAAVIATDIPGCRQALGDHQGHWLVEPRNPRVLAERIVELLDSDDERARIGIANRERINADFSVEGMNQFFQLQIEAGLGRSLSRSS
jgi:glycosyltransferase involved in cell wall biosynthesis